MAITQQGLFDKGMVLTTDKYTVEFLNHLVTACNAADVIDYETKIDMEYEPVKKPLSTQSLAQANRSPKKTHGKHKKNRR